MRSALNICDAVDKEKQLGATCFLISYYSRIFVPK